MTEAQGMLAAVWHDWQFFAKWICGEDVEIPVEE